MHPEDTATRYNRIARWWQTQHQDSLYGVAQLEQAIKFTPEKQLAIDIGCGSSGRFVKVLSEHGFQVEGLDISEEMINLAKQLHPDIKILIEQHCTCLHLEYDQYPENHVYIIAQKT